jgi:hypothetical protein
MTWHVADKRSRACRRNRPLFSHSRERRRHRHRKKWARRRRAGRGRSRTTIPWHRRHNRWRRHIRHRFFRNRMGSNWGRDRSAGYSHPSESRGHVRRQPRDRVRRRSRDRVRRRPRGKSAHPSTPQNRWSRRRLDRHARADPSHRPRTPRPERSATGDFASEVDCTPGRHVLGKRLDDLLAGPMRARKLGEVEMKNTPTVVGEGEQYIARASPATQGFRLQAPGFRFSGRERRSASPWPEGDRRIVQQGGRDLRCASCPTDAPGRLDSGPPTQSRAPRSGNGHSPSSTYGPSLRRCSSGPRRLPAGSVLAARSPPRTENERSRARHARPDRLPWRRP